MDREEVAKVVHTALAVFARIAKRTRTPADDLLLVILQGNQERLVDAVMKLLADSNVPLTDDLITKALEQVGIRV